MGPSPRRPRAPAQWAQRIALVEDTLRAATSAHEEEATRLHGALARLAQAPASPLRSRWRFSHFDTQSKSSSLKHIQHFAAAAHVGTNWDFFPLVSQSDGWPREPAPGCEHQLQQVTQEREQLAVGHREDGQLLEGLRPRAHRVPSPLGGEGLHGLSISIAALPKVSLAADVLCPSSSRLDSLTVRSAEESPFALRLARPATDSPPAPHH